MTHAVSPLSTAGTTASWAAAASVSGNTTVTRKYEVDKTLSLPIAVSSPGCRDREIVIRSEWSRTTALNRKFLPTPSSAQKKSNGRTNPHHWTSLSRVDFCVGGAPRSGSPGSPRGDAIVPAAHL